MSDPIRQVASQAPTLATKLAYSASAAGVVVAGLTINEMVGITVGIASILFAGFTAWSNHLKNRKQIELIELELAAHRADTLDKPNQPIRLNRRNTNG